MTATRRRFLSVAGAGALASVAHAGKPLPPTPAETAGPFQPKRLPTDHDADLTRVAGRSGTAKGEVIVVSGRVLRADGTPVAGALVQAWQANAAGRYDHPADDSPAPLDPDFQGAAQLRTDAAGRFRLRTIKPGAYGMGGGGMRTPHLHFDVASRDARLVTQMYFPGEALNASDALIANLSARGFDPGAMLSRRVDSGEPGVPGYAWDIVLPHA
jgi:protocatechuate 3,4-dioxygenase, beta subunit